MRMFLSAVLLCCLVSTNSAAENVVVVPIGQSGKVAAGQQCPAGSAVIGFDSEGKILCNDKTVFVTSQAYSGNLGGIRGAHDICNSHAAAAGLQGEFKAWLTTIGNFPVRDFYKSSGAYILVDGTVIAYNFYDLIDESLLKAINIDEIGDHVSSARVWTNTNAEGEPDSTSSANHCRFWSSASAAYDADYGLTVSITKVWTDYFDSTATCNEANRLYCFEQ